MSVSKNCKNKKLLTEKDLPKQHVLILGLLKKKAKLEAGMLADSSNDQVQELAAKNIQLIWACGVRGVCGALNSSARKTGSITDFNVARNKKAYIKIATTLKEVHVFGLTYKDSIQATVAYSHIPQSIRCKEPRTVCSKFDQYIEKVANGLGQLRVLEVKKTPRDTVVHTDYDRALMNAENFPSLNKVAILHVLKEKPPTETIEHLSTFDSVVERQRNFFEDQKEKLTMKASTSLNEALGVLSDLVKVATNLNADQKKCAATILGVLADNMPTIPTYKVPPKLKAAPSNIINLVC